MNKLGHEFSALLLQSITFGRNEYGENETSSSHI